MSSLVLCCSALPEQVPYPPLSVSMPIQCFYSMARGLPSSQRTRETFQETRPGEETNCLLKRTLSAFSRIFNPPLQSPCLPLLVHPIHPEYTEKRRCGRPPATLPHLPITVIIHPSRKTDLSSFPPNNTRPRAPLYSSHPHPINRSFPSPFYSSYSSDRRIAQESSISTNTTPDASSGPPLKHLEILRGHKRPVTLPVSLSRSPPSLLGYANREYISSLIISQRSHQQLTSHQLPAACVFGYSQSKPRTFCPINT